MMYVKLYKAVSKVSDPISCSPKTFNVPKTVIHVYWSYISKRCLIRTPFYVNWYFFNTIFSSFQETEKYDGGAYKKPQGTLPAG